VELHCPHPWGVQQGELDNALRGLKEGNAFRRKRENRRSIIVSGGLIFFFFFFQISSF